METFWNKLSHPILALAPMADVTDAAYRRLIAQTSMPSVMWTEFVSADGLFYTREKKGMKDSENPLMRDLLYGEGERPIVAQIFSSKPEMIRYATKLAVTLGFDGVDINMGCPDRAIERQQCGAALIKNPALARTLIEAAKEARIEAGMPSLGVSVKTRIGYNEESLDTWLPELIAAGPDAITLHLRTRKEMSKVDAHWDLMKKAVAIRDGLGSTIPLIGNGDVKSVADAKEKIAESGCDGAMLGRAIFGNPWLFSERSSDLITKEERLQALLALATYFEELSPPKSFHILRKHVKAFVSGFDGAAELRALLMETNCREEMERILAPEL